MTKLIYGCDPETKQVSQWKSAQSPRGKKVWQVQSSTKSMLIVFFNVNGIFHCDFVPPNTTVNFDFYCDALRRLRENMWRKHCNFSAATTGSFITITRPPTHPWKPQFVTNNNVVIVPHPPYSLDLAPCDFALLPIWKWNWRDVDLKQCLTSKGNCKRYLTALRKMTPRCFRSMEKIMGLLYTFPRRPF
jgi:hypothetical protein